MFQNCSKSLLVTVFSLFIMLFSFQAFAQHDGTDGEKLGAEEKLDPAKLIFEHIGDAHEFHFFDVGDFHATIPLPVILYSPETGLSMFSSSNFEHGHASYQGYEIVDGVVMERMD